VNKAIPIALLACLLSIATLPVHADDLHAAHKAIEAQYARLEAAVARQDASPLDGFATSDVRVLDVQGGELDAGQWTSVLQQGAAMGLKVSTKVEAVAWEGETVRAVARWSLHRGMRQGASIAMARQEVVAHDVWVRIGAEWRLRRSAAVRSKIWVNGELFDDAKATTPLEPAQRDAIAGRCAHGRSPSTP
jgi:ketosteroid isomerase-like protein